MEAMKVPSRDFLVRQAVLNVAAEEFPSLVRNRGTTAAVRALSRFPNVLFVGVTREYRALVSRYGREG